MGFFLKKFYQGSPVLDFMSAGWTDEKHTLYLNSMEASFVDQLYNNEYHSMDLLGRSPRPQKYSSPSQVILQFICVTYYIEVFSPLYFIYFVCCSLRYCVGAVGRILYLRGANPE